MRSGYMYVKKDKKCIIVIDKKNVSCVNLERIRGINIEYLIIEKFVYDQVINSDLYDYIRIGNTISLSYEDIEDFRNSFYYMDDADITNYMIKLKRKYKFIDILENL